MKALRLLHAAQAAVHAARLSARPLSVPVASSSSTHETAGGGTRDVAAAATPDVASAAESPAVPCTDAGCGNITVRKARARMKVLERKMAPLRAFIKAAEDAAALKRWVPAAMKDLATAWKAPKTAEAKAARQKMQQAMAAGLAAAPVLTQTEETWKYYDPAWLVDTVSYTWRDGAQERHVTFRRSTNLNHVGEETELRVNGEPAGTGIDWVCDWEDIDDHLAAWEYPLFVVKTLHLREYR